MLGDCIQLGDKSRQVTGPRFQQCLLARLIALDLRKVGCCLNSQCALCGHERQETLASTGRKRPRADIIDIDTNRLLR